MSDYRAFIAAKSQRDSMAGFQPRFVPDFLFDFQKSLLDWSVRMGRSAIFADCGLGKTPIELVWGQNVVEHTNKRVLLAAPLAVSQQIVREAEKFGIAVKRSSDGSAYPGITVTNYERLHLFNSSDFVGFIGDESSILKSFDGVRRQQITEFARGLPYRLLSTATAAPNDYIELGTSSEALGVMKHREMLARFFTHDGGDTSKWRLKGHAKETAFWSWMCSWARAIRKPSDLGFDDGGFVLPPLTEREHVVSTKSVPDGFLFSMPAVGLDEQREERRRTLRERCEKVAELVSHKEQALVWCHMNNEGSLLSELIPDAVEISGADSDEQKEEAFMAFARGGVRVLVTKPKIGGWGLNFQNCSHVTFFPSHSFEQYYQGVRRCWRFGQKRPVRVDVVTSDGERGVIGNLQNKAAQAEKMFASLVSHMGVTAASRVARSTTRARVPAWM